MNVIEQKDTLRQYYKNVRKALSKEEKHGLDLKVFNNLVDTLNLEQYSSILCYVSFGLEVDTNMYIKRLIDSGLPLYVPKCYTDDRSMKFFRLNTLKRLVTGAYNILEPIQDTHSIILQDYSNSICIVPALSFDTNGYRLGWGGGYYDRFLGSNQNVYTVGICYDCCITDSIPKDQYDVHVDMVLTENNIYLTGGNNES